MAFPVWATSPHPPCSTWAVKPLLFCLKSHRSYLKYFVHMYELRTRQKKVLAEQTGRMWFPPDVYHDIDKPISRGVIRLSLNWVTDALNVTI